MSPNLVRWIAYPTIFIAASNWADTCVGIWQRLSTGCGHDPVRFWGIIAIGAVITESICNFIKEKKNEAEKLESIRLNSEKEKFLTEKRKKQIVDARNFFQKKLLFTYSAQKKLSEQASYSANDDPERYLRWIRDTHNDAEERLELVDVFLDDEYHNARLRKQKVLDDFAEAMKRNPSLLNIITHGSIKKTRVISEFSLSEKVSVQQFKEKLNDIRTRGGRIGSVVGNQLGQIISSSGPSTYQRLEVTIFMGAIAFITNKLREEKLKAETRKAAHTASEEVIIFCQDVEAALAALAAWHLALIARITFIEDTAAAFFTAQLAYHNAQEEFDREEIELRVIETGAIIKDASEDGDWKASLDA